MDISLFHISRSSWAILNVLSILLITPSLIWPEKHEILADNFLKKSSQWLCSLFLQSSVSFTLNFDLGFPFVYQGTLSSFKNLSDTSWNLTGCIRSTKLSLFLWEVEQNQSPLVFPFCSKRFLTFCKKITSICEVRF